jgi:1,2-diacylglycerol 3-beta-galactosyltransferase
VDQNSPEADPANNMQVVIVCGKNEVLRRTLLTAVEEASKNSDPADAPASLRVLGFVNNVDQFMVAADILVTKAGPGTIAEACCCRTPILVFDFLPGQEEGNVSFVCDHEMGEHETVPSLVASRCQQWLRDPQKMATFRAKAHAQAQPTSAIDIARHTLEILQDEVHIHIYIYTYIHLYIYVFYVCICMYTYIL